jgi:uncharacterized protein YjbK
MKTKDQMFASINEYPTNKFMKIIIGELIDKYFNKNLSKELIISLSKNLEKLFYDSDAPLETLTEILDNIGIKCEKVSVVGSILTVKLKK